VTADERDLLILAPDDLLKQEVETETTRRGGPGGQHRNKTESGVRLRHRTTGVMAEASERRSQHENRRVALDRLRAALALEIRGTAVEATALPTAVCEVLQSKRWPRLSPNAQDYWRVAARVLDALAAEGGRVSEAASRLAVSTASLVKFLGTDAHLWQAAQRLRTANGLPTLRS